MKKANQIHVNAIVFAFSFTLAFLSGCGDEVTNVTNEHKMVSVKKYSDLPSCTSENMGELIFVSDSVKVFYCDKKRWVTLNGADGKDGKNGVNGKDGASIFYDSLSNFPMSEIDSKEISVAIVNYGHSIEGLGECTEKRKGEVAEKNSSYFICEQKIWRTAIPSEYDTYQWGDTIDGAQRKGKITKNLYIYDYNRWRAAVGVEKELGACVKINDLVVKKFKDAYYICKQRIWNTATTIEYDTYGKKCMKDASIESGAVHTDNKYVCDSGSFRFAKPLEIVADLGCTSYNDGTSWKIQNSNYICDRDSSLKAIMTENKDDGEWKYGDRDSSGWSYDFNHLNIGTIKDSRDGQIYKTIGIKSQVWMAENLRYNSANSKCYFETRSEDSTYCLEHGRLYKWNDAKKVCPEGWRLPDSTDWWILRKAVSSTYETSIYGTSYTGPDVYGFASLKTYYGSRFNFYEYVYASDGKTIKDSILKSEMRYVSPERSFYWSSTIGANLAGDTIVYCAELDDVYYLDIFMEDREFSMMPVRCIKK